MHPVAGVCIESGVTGLQVDLLGVSGGLSRKILIAINVTTRNQVWQIRDPGRA